MIAQIIKSFCCVRRWRFRDFCLADRVSMLTYSIEPNFFRGFILWSVRMKLPPHNNHRTISLVIQRKYTSILFQSSRYNRKESYQNVVSCREYYLHNNFKHFFKTKQQIKRKGKSENVFKELMFLANRSTYTKI